MAARNKALLRNINDVDLRLLRIFIVVADCGGFAASEFELNIGRSTISRHIADLEARIGIKLCNRGPGGFALTREGQFVLEASNRLIEAIDVFQSEINDIHKNLRGTLRFAFFDLAAGNPVANLQQAIGEFSRLAPNVDIELFTEPPTVIEAGVLSGRFDIGIVPLYRRSGGLEYHTLYSETMILYCGLNHPLFGEPEENIGGDELKKFKYAGFGFNSPNMLAGQNLKFRLSARVRNEEALKVLILSGQYLGFLPEHVAMEFVDSGSLKPVAVSETSYNVSLGAIVRRPEIARKADVFLNCLKQAHGKASH